MRDGLPPLEALRAFEAAARHASFTRAASELFVTPGAVSRQIGTLESALATRLFERKTRALALTAAGERLLRATAAAFAELRAATAELRGGDEPTVTLATTQAFASLWLIPRLADFRRRHPGIDIRISADTRLVDLERGRFDAAVRYLQDRNAPATALRLFGDTVLPVASPALLKSAGPLAKPADLAHHVLLAYEDAEQRRPWLSWPAWLAASPSTSTSRRFVPRSMVRAWRWRPRRWWPTCCAQAGWWRRCRSVSPIRAPTTCCWRRRRSPTRRSSRFGCGWRNRSRPLKIPCLPELPPVPATPLMETCPMIRRLLSLALFALAPQLAAAATVACPDLAGAVQVASCPAEEELRYTFSGYCSDDGKAYRGETDVCKDYQLYRKLKNVALWESADGNFSAYVSCDRPPAQVKAAKAVSVRVAKQGKITLLVCGYGDGLNFTWRSRAECKVEAGADCAANPAACKASCE